MFTSSQMITDSLLRKLLCQKIRVIDIIVPKICVQLVVRVLCFTEQLSSELGATVNGRNGNGNGNGNGKGSSKLPATIYSSAIENGGNLWLVWAIGHIVIMPDLPNHKFPNPTHYVQVHLKSTTLTFSALTSLHRL